MSLKTSLKDGPLIYEIVPPRRDTSRFNTELRGVENVLTDRRIDAINIPELMTRRKDGDGVRYSPTTIPPEEYALLIRDHKEPIVDIIAPRLGREQLLARTRKILGDYGIRNLVIVGKERHEDPLSGPSVLEALSLINAERAEDLALGGICIFGREVAASADYGVHSRLTEARRVWAKAGAGCDFVTSQICFDAEPALRFLAAYGRLCEKTGAEPLTVFVSLATVPSASIMALIESLDVAIPPKVKKRILSADRMGQESLKVAGEIFQRIVSESERRRDGVPLGLQVEQVGINSGELSLELLDGVYRTLR